MDVLESKQRKAPTKEWVLFMVLNQSECPEQV